jgi:hypothetical protein
MKSKSTLTIKLKFYGQKNTISMTLPTDASTDDIDEKLRNMGYIGTLFWKGQKIRGDLRKIGIKNGNMIYVEIIPMPTWMVKNEWDD